MLMHGFGIMGSLILLALGMGYFVCADAKKQTGTLKTLGYIIGTAIIVLSIIAGFYKTYFHGSWVPGKQCPMMKGQMKQGESTMQGGMMQKGGMHK